VFLVLSPKIPLRCVFLVLSPKIPLRCVFLVLSPQQMLYTVTTYANTTFLFVSQKCLPSHKIYQYVKLLIDIHRAGL